MPLPSVAKADSHRGDDDVGLFNLFVDAGDARLVGDLADERRVTARGDGIAGEVNRHARRRDVNRHTRAGGTVAKKSPPPAPSNAVVAFALVVVGVPVDAGVHVGVHACRVSLGEPLARSLQRTVRNPEQGLVDVGDLDGRAAAAPLRGVRASAPAPRPRERLPRGRLRAGDRAAVLLAAAADPHRPHVHQLTEPVVRDGGAK